jgi:hypothetical protein
LPFFPAAFSPEPGFDTTGPQDGKDMAAQGRERQRLTGDFRSFYARNAANCRGDYTFFRDKGQFTRRETPRYRRLVFLPQKSAKIRDICKKNPTATAKKVQKERKR